MDLSPTQPTTTLALCDAVAARTGRRIRLLSTALTAGGPCGVRIATVDTDYIVTDAQCEPVLRDHTVLHEIGHILCDHGGVLDPAGLSIEDPLNVLPAGALAHARLNFDDQIEREAEWCAYELRTAFFSPDTSAPTVLGWR